FEQRGGVQCVLESRLGRPFHVNAHRVTAWAMMARAAELLTQQASEGASQIIRSQFRRATFIGIRRSEFGPTVIVFGLPTLTQQSTSAALRQTVGNELAMPNLATHA